MANWWQKFSPPQSIWLTILTFSFCGGNTNLVQAQVIADDTLGNEASVVNQISETLQQIDGGALRGENLFHSFLEFSINQGNAVYFSHPAEVVNIFSRVTGTNISNILGTLGVSGDANLYFVNPNGILFGPKAQLDIAGSFVVSSGSSFILPNGMEYSATNPQAPPLLTVNATAPIGIKFEGIPGTITSQAELITVPQQTIALVGGEVNIEGGKIIAEDGRIELGSVGNNSIVNFTTSDLGLLALDYSQANNFADLSFSDIAFLDTSGDRGGEIELQGQNITLSDDTFIISTTYGTENGGNLTFNAIESINLTGFSSIIIESKGNITMTTPEINLNNQSQITVNSDGLIEANVGEINLNSESITLNNQSQISVSTSAGQGGNLNLNAQKLTLENGSKILTTTSGKSKAGNINLIIGEQVIISGFDTGILADTTYESTGKGGNITLQTPELLIENGGIIAVDSYYGKGEAGNLTISTENLTLNQGTISAETTSGDGGNINLTIQEVLTMRNFSQISTTAGNQQTGGNGGNINIFARYILAIPEENTDITANAFTVKEGGQIFIATNAIFGVEPRDELSPLSDITASSEFRLNVDPLEVLTNLPEIRTEVPVVQQGCDVGGKDSISFYDLGKGGLPAKPGDYLIIDSIMTPWIPLTHEVNPQSWNLEKNKSVKISDSDAQFIFTFSCGNN